MTVFRSRTDAALIEEPAKLCGSVAPSCDWVCAEPKGHAGRHGWKHGTTTASWPNLPELNATIVARDATIARLERELAATTARLEFAHAGNATLTEGAAATARELGQVRRDLAEANSRTRTLADQALEFVRAARDRL